MTHELQQRDRSCSLARTWLILIGTVALAVFHIRATAADRSPAAIKLPRLYKVPLNYQGVDIRHALYHKQGFQPAAEGRVQLEIVDIQPNHDDGSLWFWGGRSARSLVRYDPATGDTQTHPLPAGTQTDERLPAHLYLLVKGGKVYLFDLRAPRSHVGVYDVTERRLSFAPLLPANADDKPIGIVTGIAPMKGPYLYLFVGADAEDTSREPKGLIRWDTGEQRGVFLEYTYSGPGPLFGAESPDGREIWCPIWNGNALARFDTRAGKWNGFWKTPFEKETQPTYAGMLGERFFCVDLSRPRLLPFDTKSGKWQKPIPVPGHGTTFGVLGAGWIDQGKLFCSMATLKGYIPHGGPIGVDGKPWHFLDRHLCYDPESDSFTHQVLAGADGEYWMNSVKVQHGPHVYFVAIDLARPDGTVDQFGRGNVAIFQTHPRGEVELQPTQYESREFSK